MGTLSEAIAHLGSYLAEFFLEWEKFHKNL